MLVEIEKLTESYRLTKGDLEETVDRLHQANRVRHDLEVRLHAELEAAYRLKQTLDEKIIFIGEQEIKLDYFE